MIVCICNRLGEGTCREMACRPECESLACLYRALGARVRCGRCVPYMQALLAAAKRSEDPCPCAEAGTEAGSPALAAA